MRSNDAPALVGTALTTEQVTGGRPLDEWLQRLLAQDDEILRMTGFMRLLETISTGDGAKAALDALLAKYGAGSRGKELMMLFEKWAQFDPKGALAYAQGLKGNGEKWSGVSAALKTWARSSVSDALAWADANGQGGKPEDGNWAVATIVTQLARTDLDRAMQTAQGQAVSRARGRMIESLVSELMTQRGEQAARDAVLGLAEGPFRDGMLTRLAGQLADKDAQAAAQWAFNLPPGDGRTRALTEAVGKWASEDPVAAGNYLTRLPATPDTDPLRERYAWSVGRQDPEGALAWANSITDADARNSAVEGLARAWMRRDAQAAQNWLAQSPLSEEAKARILRPR